ncbi:hypothetical protein BC831DRAFT_477902 [Entophlyctis helioformis]|nr:hypothetical protein BC831DRAFT_477902 [Entophlyctis helioformis]
MSSKENKGDAISNAYLSSGFQGGVDNGLRRMLGVEPKAVNEVCIDCGRSLVKESDVFVGPTHAGAHVYCQPCYASHFSKGVCQECKLPVLGLGQDWVSESPDRVWHKPCYKGSACHECGKVIYGQAVGALGRQYHPECFVCFNCRKWVEGAFVEMGGEACCKGCSEEIHKARAGGAVSASSGSKPDLSSSFSKLNTGRTAPSAAGASVTTKPPTRPAPTSPAKSWGQAAPDLGTVCAKCTKPIQSASIQLPDGRLFHADCFSCATCSKPITSGKFVVDGTSAHHPECRVLIVPASKAPVCAKCAKPITGKFIQPSQGEMLHSACFVCTGCAKPLASEPYNDTPSGPKCEQCLRAGKVPNPETGQTAYKAGLKDVMGSRIQGSAVSTAEAALAGLKALGGTNTCPKCSKAVYPFEKAGGPANTSWHKACLKCARCRVQLDSMAKMKGLEPFCTSCATF